MTRSPSWGRPPPARSGTKAWVAVKIAATGDLLLALNDGERRISESIYRQYPRREHVLQGDVLSDKYFIPGQRNNHVHNNTLARLQRLLVVTVAAAVRRFRWSSGPGVWSTRQYLSWGRRQILCSNPSSDFAAPCAPAPDKMPSTVRTLGEYRDHQVSSEVRQSCATNAQFREAALISDVCETLFGPSLAPDLADLMF